MGHPAPLSAFTRGAGSTYARRMHDREELRHLYALPADEAADGVSLEEVLDEVLPRDISEGGGGQDATERL